MNATYVMTGTLTDGMTVRLDGSLPVTEGKVQVTLKMVEKAERPKQSLSEYLDELRLRQAARGHVPMSVEEVEAYIKEERDSWGD